MAELSLIFATLNDSIATNLTMAHAIHQLQFTEIDYEIILVDNGNIGVDKVNTETFLRYHKNFPITYYKYSVLGIIPPHSFGVIKATGKYIMMPDPHVIFSKDYFQIMLDTLKQLENKNVKMVFSPFSVESVALKEHKYVSERLLKKPNPFIHPNGIGEHCKFGIEPYPILHNTMSSLVCERDWFLKTGNMFPEAFVNAGGHTAESIIIGLTTWMFGGKCYIQPKAVIEHPVYRNKYGTGWFGNMASSMAIGAYILGGRKYLDEMPKIYGKQFNVEEIIKLATPAREYVEKNAKITLDELVENWENIRYA